MLELLGLDEYDPALLASFAGGIIGIAFGALAQMSRFCLRRGVIRDAAQDQQGALGIWAMALLAALLLTQTALIFGEIDLSETRFISGNLPLGGLLLGGLAFGAGMVLARGCASRLTVLAATGNLRAALGMVIFGLLAYATLRGVLSPLRVALVETTSVDLGLSSALPDLLQISPWFFVGGAATVLVILIWRSATSWQGLWAGFGIGALVAVGWLLTGWGLFDEFDPQPVQSIAFTLSAADTVFFSMASTAISPNFGVGLIPGVLFGSYLSARWRGEIRLVSFETPQQTLRYLAGVSLMGIGGVIAGGCSLGHGISGVATLSLGSLLALISIIIGARAMDKALK